MTNDQRSGGKRDGRIAIRARSHTRKSLAVILVVPIFAMESWPGPVRPAKRRGEFPRPMARPSARGGGVRPL
jgi:hypothetical protein